MSRESEAYRSPWRGNPSTQPARVSVAQIKALRAKGPPPVYEIHEHPIRWDAPAQLWQCSQGCGYSRPKRETETCPGPDYGLEHQPWITRTDRIPKLPPEY